MKVTITIEDLPDGGVNVDLTSDSDRTDVPSNAETLADMVAEMLNDCVEEIDKPRLN